MTRSRSRIGLTPIVTRSAAPPFGVPGRFPHAVNPLLVGTEAYSLLGALTLERGSLGGMVVSSATGHGTKEAMEPGQTPEERRAIKRVMREYGVPMPS